ncbi:hypothetical protein DACRYDRAFT_107065 [Dacryopinax primogenitus]|uniref:Uncharacterized protein n=1 Tax=Dacryopinax primogenitus (strain DJM 731) TaxID=1858805 RepID=M5G046_DACPD|nr:uncharacterized protein DACRYDRAFT_107065 [Dacryopinax primogenitus]EJU02124.1 hypothetical protein DACRYDRAFT_107065 [Dacryopinax primogenitus]
MLIDDSLFELNAESISNVYGTISSQAKLEGKLAEQNRAGRMPLQLSDVKPVTAFPLPDRPISFNDAKELFITSARPARSNNDELSSELLPVSCSEQELGAEGGPEEATAAVPRVDRRKDGNVGVGVSTRSEQRAVVTTGKIQPTRQTVNVLPVHLTVPLSPVPRTVRW